MTFKESIEKSVKENNSKLAGRIADILRYNKGFNYNDTFQFFHKITNISQADFDELMYYSDH